MALAFESKLNILLSELLNQMGVTEHSEYIGLTQNQGGYPGSLVGIVCILGRGD